MCEPIRPASFPHEWSWPTQADYKTQVIAAEPAEADREEADMEQDQVQ